MYKQSDLKNFLIREIDGFSWIFKSTPVIQEQGSHWIQFILINHLSDKENPTGHPSMSCKTHDGSHRFLQSRIDIKLQLLHRMLLKCRSLKKKKKSELSFIIFSQIKMDFTSKPTEVNISFSSRQQNMSLVSIVTIINH